jgi:HD-GYP domain-containing protein (c-di-GMP phosphodiesterase class II)
VYVKNPYSDYEPEELIKEETRIKTVKIAHKTFETYKKSKVINVVELEQAIKMIINDVMGNGKSLLYLTDIRTHDDYTFGHSINTCLISIVIGLKMGLSIQKVNELALGVMLHDVGKMMIPAELLNKTTPLTPDEWQEIQKHAGIGFDILRKTIPAPAAHVAYQHHENYDGSGYPRKISGEDIHQYARIAAVADLYDAITSDRPYRLAMLPHQAYEVIIGSRTAKLDPKIADIFLETVALYPVGTMVLLDNDEIGVVIEVYPKLQARPLIQVILDKNRAKISNRYIDLSKELTRFIAKVLQPKEIIKL